MVCARWTCCGTKKKQKWLYQGPLSRSRHRKRVHIRIMCSNQWRRQAQAGWDYDDTGPRFFFSICTTYICNKTKKQWRYRHVHSCPVKKHGAPFGCHCLPSPFTTYDFFLQIDAIYARMSYWTCFDLYFNQKKIISLIQPSLKKLLHYCTKEIA